MPSIPLSHARRYVLDRVERLGPVRVPLFAARDLVLAETLVAAEPVPPFANTAMDGFAVLASDTVGAPVTLRVVGTLAAGAAPWREVSAGEAIRIMTGAPMPPGADAVVMVELTEFDESAGTVVVREAVRVGNHVRPAGEDLAPGQEVFAAGTALSAGHLGVLASIGVLEPLVYKRPKVGVLSTGDELVDGPQPLRPGQIRDSNRHTLVALLQQNGFEPVDLGCAPDTEEAITAALQRGVRDCDALVTSGGVSMGAFDYVKVVLDRIGEMRWMQVDIKPAKPLAFGTVDGVPVFGLPGNPVSSMVSFELFARPALRKMAGHRADAWVREPVLAIADELFRRPRDGKIHFNRVTAAIGSDGRYHARFSGGQGSHQLFAMANAQALAVMEPGESDVAPGGEIPVLVLG